MFYTIAFDVIDVLHSLALASFSTIFYSYNQNEKDSVPFEPTVKGPQVSETLPQLATRPMYFTFPIEKRKNILRKILKQVEYESAPGMKKCFDCWHI